MSTWKDQKPRAKNEGQLLLIFISPHKFVTSQTVSRWIVGFEFCHCLEFKLLFLRLIQQDPSPLLKPGLQAFLPRKC